MIWKNNKDCNYIPRVGLSEEVKYFIEWFDNNKNFY